MRESANKTMLSLHSVCINNDQICLVRDLSLTLLPGALVYLRGRNASGKTSLLRVIAGIRKPASGQLTLGRHSVLLEDMPRPYCTYIGHALGIRGEFTLQETLSFWAKIYDAPELVPAAIRYFKLEKYINTRCYRLSAGQKQRVALCRLICCPSDIWLLDEAENNLDAETRLLLNNLMVTKANNGGIVIASTHSINSDSNETGIKSAITLSL